VHVFVEVVAQLEKQCMASDLSALPWKSSILELEQHTHPQHTFALETPPARHGSSVHMFVSNLFGQSGCKNSQVQVYPR
jgi:hypothetical protein